MGAPEAGLLKMRPAGTGGAARLGGAEDCLPYRHEDQLLMQEDTVEFFNLVLEMKADEQEKKGQVSFMRLLVATPSCPSVCCSQRRLTCVSAQIGISRVPTIRPSRKARVAEIFGT